MKKHDLPNFKSKHVSNVIVEIRLAQSSTVGRIELDIDVIFHKFRNERFRIDRKCWINIDW